MTTAVHMARIFARENSLLLYTFYETKIRLLSESLPILAQYSEVLHHMLVFYLFLGWQVKQPGQGEGMGGSGSSADEITY